MDKNPFQFAWLEWVWFFLSLGKYKNPLVQWKIQFVMNPLGENAGFRCGVAATAVKGCWLVGNFGSLGLPCSALLPMVYLWVCFLQNSPDGCSGIQVCIFLAAGYGVIGGQLVMTLLVGKREMRLELLPPTWGVVFGWTLDVRLLTLAVASCTITWWTGVVLVPVWAFCAWNAPVIVGMPSVVDAAGALFTVVNASKLGVCWGFWPGVVKGVVGRLGASRMRWVVSTVGKDRWC